MLKIKMLNNIENIFVKQPETVILPFNEYMEIRDLKQECLDRFKKSKECYIIRQET